LLQQFVTYVFDDVHLKFADLFNAKAAALRHLASLPPTDRVAIFSMSGYVMLDFTNDHGKVRESISKLQPSPTRTGVDEQLPDVGDLPRGPGAGEQTPSLPERTGAEAAMLAQQANEREFHHRAQSRDSVDGLAAVVGRVSIMPGLKTIVVISPDFYIPDTPIDVDRYQSLVDSAVRAHVHCPTPASSWGGAPFMVERLRCSGRSAIKRLLFLFQRPAAITFTIPANEPDGDFTLLRVLRTFEETGTPLPW
jgi:hypothetical protein